MGVIVVEKLSTMEATLWPRAAGPLDAAATGVVSANATIVTNCYEELVRYATRILNDPYDAEDSVQDVLVKVLDSRRNSNSSVSRAYLFTAVRNRCRDAIRRKKHRTKEARALLQLHETSEPAALLPERGASILQHVYFAVEQLPKRMRLVFTLLVIEGLPSKVVAERLSITQQSVRNQKGQALAHIRKLIGPYY